MTVSQVDELVAFINPGTDEKVCTSFPSMRRLRLRTVLVSQLCVCSRILSQPKMQVAAPALEIIEGLSGGMDGIAALRLSADKLSNNLLLAIPRPGLSRSAATCLVNLSQDQVHCKALIAASACSRLITCVVEGKTLDHDLVTMTLSNLTRTSEGAAQALQVRTGSSEVAIHSTARRLLVKHRTLHRTMHETAHAARVCHMLERLPRGMQVAQGAVEKSSMRKLLSMALNPGTSDVLYEHVAGVLCNITQQRVGRELLVESSLHGLRAVVDMLVSPSDVKRTGSAAAIKNVVRC